MPPIIIAQTEFWDRLLSQNNIQLAIIVGLAVFGYFRVWPFIEKRIEAADARSRADQERYFQSLSEVVKMHTLESDKRDAIQLAGNNAIANLSQSIEALIHARQEEHERRK